MKSIPSIHALLLLTTAASAQITGGSTGSTSSPGASPSTPGTAPGSIPGSTPGSPTTPGTPGSTFAPGLPSVTPGPTTPSPADSATFGRAPGVNPSNSQDLTRRSNPQDLTAPGGSNSQDQLPPAPNVPNIMVPERR